MNLAMDRGAPFPDTIFATAERHPDRADLIRLWHDRWIEMFTPRIDGSWTILRALREAGVSLGWSRFVGAQGAMIGLDRFGASAPYQVLAERFGFTAEAVAEVSRLTRG